MIIINNHLSFFFPGCESFSLFFPLEWSESGGWGWIKKPFYLLVEEELLLLKRRHFTVYNQCVVIPYHLTVRLGFSNVTWWISHIISIFTLPLSLSLNMFDVLYFICYTYIYTAYIYIYIYIYMYVVVRIIGTLGKYDQRRLWKFICIVNPFDLLF